MFKSLKALIGDEKDLISNMANMSAFFMENLIDINWVGFYIAHDDVLKLGPFQGKPACNNILKGKGVCGTCFETQKSIIVDDVHEFKGHITCDPISKSEIVVPIIRNGKFIALLDIDSPKNARFTKDDLIFLEKCLELL